MEGILQLLQYLKKIFEIRLRYSEEFIRKSRGVHYFKIGLWITKSPFQSAV